MKKCFLILLAIAFMAPIFLNSCKDDDEPTQDDKPTIENASVTPSSDVKYGDELSLKAKLSDATALKSYAVRFSNAEGSIYDETQMLTGKSQDLDVKLYLPLPKNAKVENITMTLTVTNSNNKTASTEVVLSNVQVPQFEELYIILENNNVLTMEKNADGLYEYEGDVPANVKGKIYTHNDKTGLYWGDASGAVSLMGNNSITIGKASEVYFKITFDIATFALVLGDELTWTEIDEPFYIYGVISGHWADGDVATEIQSMKMQGYQLGDKKYWSWTPPSLDAGDPNSGVAGYDMWGNMNPGAFRFKKGDVEEYILYSGGAVATGTANNKDESFLSSAGGHLTIKLYFDGEKYTEVSIEGENKVVSYKGDAILINGIPKPTEAKFAGTTLNLKEGTHYVYESIVPLTNNQSITAVGADLTIITPNPDVFTGKGNATWTMKGLTGDWLIRLDPFTANIYAGEMSGYPNVIYMDGWGWGIFETDASANWPTDGRLSLQRIGTTGYVYEATFYYFGWSSDFAIFTKPYNQENSGKYRIANRHFPETSPYSTSKIGMLLPGDVAGYYKIKVDLKGGVVFSDTELEVVGASDGEAYKSEPATPGDVFKITFTLQ